MALLPCFHHGQKTFQSRSAPVTTTTRVLVSKASKKQKSAGYAQVADFISTDKELAVYRRFDRTATRVLLILQSEILAKQEQLDEIDSEDAQDTDDKRMLAPYTIAEEFPGPFSNRDRDRSRLCKELRELLQEYCKQ